MRDLAAKAAQSQTGYNIVIVPGQGPSSPEEKLLYVPLKEKGIDTVLEISVSRLALVGEWDLNPPLEFQMGYHIRLVQTSDGKEMYDLSSEYVGKTMTFSQWAENNAQAFYYALDTAYQSIAEKIVREVLNPQGVLQTDGS